MDRLFKDMLVTGLLVRLAKAMSDSKLFTEHEMNFINEEVSKISENKSGKGE